MIIITEQVVKKPGRPRSGTRPVRSVKVNTTLSSKEMRILIEEGKYLFKELKRLFIEHSDNKIVEFIQEHTELAEVLDKWEAEAK